MRIVFLLMSLFLSQISKGDWRETILLPPAQGAEDPWVLFLDLMEERNAAHMRFELMRFMQSHAQQYPRATLFVVLSKEVFPTQAAVQSFIPKKTIPKEWQLISLVTEEVELGRKMGTIIQNLDRTCPHVVAGEKPQEATCTDCDLFRLGLYLRHGGGLVLDGLRQQMEFHFGDRLILTDHARKLKKQLRPLGGAESKDPLPVQEEVIEGSKKRRAADEDEDEDAKVSRKLFKELTLDPLKPRRPLSSNEPHYLAVFPCSEENRPEKIAEAIIALMGVRGENRHLSYKEKRKLLGEIAAASAYGENDLYVGGVPLLTKPNSNRAFLQAIAMLPVEVRAWFVAELKSVAAMLTFFPAKEMVSLLLPWTREWSEEDLPRMLRAEDPEGNINLIRNVAGFGATLTAFVQEVSVEPLRPEEKVTCTVLDTFDLDKEGKQNYKISIKRIESVRPVSIFVISGPLYPQEQLAGHQHPFGAEDRLNGPILNLPPLFRSHISVDRDLKTKAGVALASIVVGLSLEGDGFSRAWENKNGLTLSHQGRENHRHPASVVLPLLPVGGWNITQFLTYLSQLAWIHDLSQEWSPKLIELQALLAHPAENHIVPQVADFFTPDVAGERKAFLLQAGFTPAEVDILFGHFAEYQNMKVAPAPLAPLPPDNPEVERRAKFSSQIMSSGNPRKAIELLKEALAIIEKDPESVSKNTKGFVLGNLGVSYQTIGEIHLALKYHRMHEALIPENEDPAAHARTCANLGICYQNMGELEKALAYHEKHLRIVQEAGLDRASEGRAHCNRGISLSRLHRYAEAIECHTKHLEIARETYDLAAEGRAYANLGVAYKEQGELSKALHHHLLHAFIATVNQDHQGRASAYGNLATVFDAFEMPKFAAALHRKCVEIYHPESRSGNVLQFRKGLHSLTLSEIAAEEFPNAEGTIEKLFAFARQRNERVPEALARKLTVQLLIAKAEKLHRTGLPSHELWVQALVEVQEIYNEYEAEWLEKMLGLEENQKIRALQEKILAAHADINNMLGNLRL